MTYQLPEPALPNCVIGKDSTMRQIRLDCYTADQMQAAYAAGRDSMKAECVKAVHNCLNDYVFTADMAGHAGRHLQLAENAIKELK